MYIVYIYIFVKKIDMDAPNNKRRKLIDIPDDAFKVLTIAAIDEGTSLKGYIEKIIVDKALSLNNKVIVQINK